MSLRTYLFVHGAWHASWCWQKIAAALSKQGHFVLTPDLPGHGKAWQPPDTVTLACYVANIVALINRQTTPVTLIGHSMAGMIISAVAECLPDAIAELIFVAAYIPKTNESLLAITEQSDSQMMLPHLTFDVKKQALHVRVSSALIPIFFNRCHVSDVQVILPQLQTQPLRPWRDAVVLGSAFDRVSKRSFIAKADRALSPRDQLAMSQAVTDRILYIEADHAVYCSAADEIIKLLT
ncbi:MAG: hypothetical protein A3F43_06845 [Gammaproteobacteria bacterium RIFCSPHIGHO2_12_FULL_42_10]|nr:MAG: hypothetical protein A3F43_06845 [Gammaproteobacteria bacterium RIFCSPHIGHO2_12_FULL_42_10]